MQLFLVHFSDSFGSQRNPMNVVPQAPPPNENFSNSGDRKKEKKGMNKSKLDYHQIKPSVSVTRWRKNPAGIPVRALRGVDWIFFYQRG